MMSFLSLSPAEVGPVNNVLVRSVKPSFLYKRTAEGPRSVVSLSLLQFHSRQLVRLKVFFFLVSLFLFFLLFSLCLSFFLDTLRLSSSHNRLAQHALCLIHSCSLHISSRISWVLSFYLLNTYIAVLRAVIVGLFFPLL